MAISEKGHAKNVANLEALNAFIQGYGTPYNPANTSIALSALRDLHTDASAALDAVEDHDAALKVSVNDRQAAFKALKPLATRIINALEASGASDAIIQDARGINKKIQGTSLRKDPDATPPPTPANTVSASQQSYDMLIEHFSTLLSLLRAEPLYAPNEPTLSVPELTTFLTQLTSLNTHYKTKYTAASNARLQRNNLLYTPDTGLVDTALDAKKYIKSLFGASSPQYKQVSGIEFRNR